MQATFPLDYQILISLLTGAGALILSFYNLWLQNRGARIKIGPVYSIGALSFKGWPKPEGGLMEKPQKALYVPLNLINSGISIATIWSVKLTVLLDDQHSYELLPNRRVSLTKATDSPYIKQEDMKSQAPMLPIYVNPHEGITHFFEYSDINTSTIIPLEKEVILRLQVNYDTKTVTRDYKIIFMEKGINDSGGISFVWLRLGETGSTDYSLI